MHNISKSYTCVMQEYSLPNDAKLEKLWTICSTAVSVIISFLNAITGIPVRCTVTMGIAVVGFRGQLDNPFSILRPVHCNETI